MTTTHWQGPSRYLPFERVLTQIGLHLFWSDWLAVDVAVLIEPGLQTAEARHVAPVA